jgi:hypothetical protein
MNVELDDFASPKRSCTSAGSGAIAAEGPTSAWLGLSVRTVRSQLQSKCIAIVVGHQITGLHAQSASFRCLTHVSPLTATLCGVHMGTLSKRTSHGSCSRPTSCFRLSVLATLKLHRARTHPFSNAHYGNDGEIQRQTHSGCSFVGK